MIKRDEIIIGYYKAFKSFYQVEKPILFSLRTPGV